MIEMSHATNTCVCGTAFTPKAKARNQKYCSSRCRERTWAAANREQLNANVRAYRRRRFARDGYWRETGPKVQALKAWMLELKSRPCADCGGCFEVCCMDFDHRPGTTKKYNVGSMFAHHYSRELIETEIAKCDLVCANCHRIRTRDRGRGRRKKRERRGI